MTNYAGFFLMWSQGGNCGHPPSDDSCMAGKGGSGGLSFFARS